MVASTAATYGRQWIRADLVLHSRHALIDSNKLIADKSTKK